MTKTCCYQVAHSHDHDHSPGVIQALAVWEVCCCAKDVEVEDFLLEMMQGVAYDEKVVESA